MASWCNVRCANTKRNPATNKLQKLSNRERALFMDTKARLGAQLLAEQRKVLEKWKLADTEPATIGIEYLSPEQCEAAEDDLEG